MDEVQFMTHIRLKAVNENQEQRSINRSSALNTNRTDLNKIEERLKAPSLTEFKKLCVAYVRHKKGRDLYRIRIGLSLGPDFITAFHDTEGALYCLITSLTGGTPKLQMESLYCIINMGLGNEGQCRRVCDKAGIYLTSLGSDNDTLQELCLWAFGNLCGGHPKVCFVAHKQGLEATIAQSLTSQLPVIVQSAAYALNHYLGSVQNRIRVFSSPDLIRSVMNAATTNKAAMQPLCWSLFTMSTQKVLCTTLVDLGVVSFSLKLLTEEGDLPAICTPLVRLLTNCIASCNNVAIELCYQTDVLVPICCKLLNSSQSFLIKETIQLIANIFNAATIQPITGDKVLEDSNFKLRLEPHLKRALASHFEPSKEAVMQFG